jgi:hypothetical protein
VDNALLSALRRLPLPVVVALLWAVVVVLAWVGRLPEVGTFAVDVVNAGEAMGGLGITLLLAVGPFVAYPIGRMSMAVQAWTRGWLRGFGSIYVRVDGFDSWLRRRDALDRLVDDCIELHSAFPGLFPKLGFRHPDSYELTDRNRAGLERSLREDLEWVVEFSSPRKLDEGVARRLRRSQYCSAVALPFACLVAMVAGLAGMGWILGCLIGMVLWQGLYSLAMDDQYEAFRLVLQAANRGFVDLYRTADYGWRTFGSPQQNYNPYTHDVATGAALLDGQS